ncbi:MAG: Pre-mRNA-splicing factor [Cyphobasidiales sp. Tagirdzhanova-0007]|nr:MAG: Pre-mRNA-splicing factor [Cyphobasidiales sp. Tagirdzhanova-0007]
MKVSNNMEEVLLKHFDEWGDIERIKILQSRGVGFVTYFSELSAQFAKESMMNQSLDGEEVVNVRWATEDPNPTAKVYEYDRLVEMGMKGIGSKLTPEFVAAVRKMDELEGLVEPLGEQVDPDDVRAVGGPPKRLHIENGLTAAKKTKIAAPPTAPAKGLLSGSAMDSLRKAAALRRAKQQKAVPIAPEGVTL